VTSAGSSSTQRASTSTSTSGATDEGGTTEDAAAIVVVNGQDQRMAPATTVAELVASWCSCADGVAVALNREIVPRSQWTHTALEPGDHVEIVTAAAGG